MRRVFFGLIPLLTSSVVGLVATGCAQEKGGGSVKTTLVVYAASSLTEAFQSVEEAFEKANSEIEVKISFAGSQVLRVQIEQGAQVDVFASANQGHMNGLIASGHIPDSKAFASNELVLVVPRANPAAIEVFGDLTKASLIVLGSDNAPVGIYTRQMLDRAGLVLGRDFLASVLSHVVSLEHNVRLVRSKVEMGEADAAIIYRTEASSARLKMVPIPKNLNAQVRYPIGVLARSANASQAKRFVDYVLSEEGRRILYHHDFLGAE